MGGGGSLLSESKQRERERPREETSVKPEFRIYSLRDDPEIILFYCILFFCFTPAEREAESEGAAG